jgi:hypothetical protein
MLMAEVRNWRIKLHFRGNIMNKCFVIASISTPDFLVSKYSKVTLDSVLTLAGLDYFTH